MRPVWWGDAAGGDKLQGNSVVTCRCRLRLLLVAPRVPTAPSGSSPVYSAGGAVGGFDELVREHAGAMYRVAVAIVRDSSLAEDVVQEAIIRAWDHMDTFRGEGPIQGWLLRITHNAAVSMLRRSREDPWDPQRIPEQAVGGPERQLIARSDLEAAFAGLKSLDELSLSILALRVGVEMPYQEIADTLGISLGQVKIRLLRARRALAAEVERGGP